MQPGYYWYWEHNNQGEATNAPELVRVGHAGWDEPVDTTAELIVEFHGTELSRSDLDHMRAVGRFSLAAIVPPTEPPPIMAMLVGLQSQIITLIAVPRRAEVIYLSRDLGVPLKTSFEANFEPLKAIKPREFHFAGVQNGDYIYRERELL